MATSGDLDLATSGDFLMATDRQSVLPLLLEAYDRSRELVKAATLRRTLENEEISQ
jgi:hypothetical protein